ncbi:hypothetical protein AJ78_04060 [Emergomyces pasteurianus Ep9510]|uniref:Aminoglycoside phosphotransferase domain-containing protein n=1 Tax=Emergomyces pasteurianus Ep9510 TaxID=1447872 RepID=A0A1J9QIG6_9EURO|nr:hypothetical protein AJ78_04060 [Emergomyces pasteurianus Ep9510]
MTKKTQLLLRGEITYSLAKDEEVNILHRLSYVYDRNKFFASLGHKRDWMKAIVAHHLGLHSPDCCSISDYDDWVHGSFNVCVPVTVSSDWKGKMQPSQRLMLRFPLKYRVGDSFQPGNGDEKLRCEAGTYAWFQQNAADVPIPQLYGFGLSTGETFTALNSMPFWDRSLFKFRRLVLSWLGWPLPSQYLRHQPGNRIAKSRVTDAGYLLIEYIEEVRGRMLSETWSDKRHDNQLRANLFHSLAQILLSMTRVKLPHIGSFIIDNDGYLRLANRPLAYIMQEFENERIPTDMPRDYTYSTVESYVLDTLRLHDNRILHQPNAINDATDYNSQTAVLTAMRAAYPSFLNHGLRRGPFFMTLTDFNQSNILVDENWNVTCLVDLEWVCSKPVEMFNLPIWLTCKAVDEIAEESEEYGRVRQELVDAIATEEEKLLSYETSPQEQEDEVRLSTILNKVWETGSFWYSLGLASPAGIWAIFHRQIQPRFLKKCSTHEGFQSVMPWYWSTEFVDIAIQKILDKEKYDIQLREAFGLSSDDSNNKPQP